MRHELRTPLHIITGLAYVLEQSELNDKQSEQVAKVKAAAAKLSQLIDDVLAYATTEDGELTHTAVLFDVHTVMNKSCKVAKLEAERKGLAFSCHRDEAVPRTLIGDPDRLAKVLIHLLDNAVKFTDVGTVSLNVQLLDRQEQTCTVQFKIQDTGIGIAADDIERVFGAFFQVDDSAARHQDGIGLGLRLCRSLVESMGAELAVQSEPAAGSTFYFALEFGLQAARSPSKHASHPNFSSATESERPLAEQGKTPVDTPETSDVDWSELIAYLDNLAELLGDGDAEAGSAVNELAASMAAAGQQDQWRTVREYVNNYEFDEALASLKAVQKRLREKNANEEHYAN